jgi:hypothetical protein
MSEPISSADKPKPPVPGSRRPVKRKTSRLEMEYRRRSLLTLLRQGYSVPDLREFAQKEWGVKPQVASDLVNQAMALAVEAMSVHDLQRIAAVVFLRFEVAYRMAYRMKNPAAMVAANDAMAKYWVKTPPEVVITGDGGEDEDHLGDF